MALHVEHLGPTLRLSLDRPHCLNAIDEATARALLDALAAAEHAPEVRVVVLRGHGRAFCSGRDISAAPTADILALVQAVSTALVQCSKPIVAAVHGWAVGAGVEWMLDADIALATRSARFRLPEAQIGVFATGGVTALLPRMAGLARAKGLLMLGEPFSAEQALHWGLVWSVVDDDVLEAETARVAALLAACEPAVLARFKRVLNQMSIADFAACIATETQMQTELMALRPA